MCFYPQSPLDRIPIFFFFFFFGGVCFLKVVFSPDIYRVPQNKVGLVIEISVKSSFVFFYNKKIQFMHISLSVGMEKSNI